MDAGENARGQSAAGGEGRRLIDVPLIPKNGVGPSVSVGPRYLGADPRRQLSHLDVADREHAARHVEGGELLVLERHARRQWGDVPVDMAVAPLAAQRQQVDALGAGHAPHGLADPTHQVLQPQILRAMARG